MHHARPARNRLLALCFSLLPGLAAAKANPGQINYSSGGNDSPQHAAMALFADAAAGKLKLLGVGSRAPLPAFPGAPTISESGLPGFEFNSVTRSPRAKYTEAFKEAAITND